MRFLIDRPWTKTRFHGLTADRPSFSSLYNAIADQIPAKSHNHISLRKLAAEEMRAHADDYMPFMTDDNGDMLDQGEEGLLSSHCSISQLLCLFRLIFNSRV